MKNTKEIKAILTAIYCINQTGAKDEDIRNLTDYAFRRIFASNANMLTLACVGRSKEQLMPELMEVLDEDTVYRQYLQSKEDK